MNITDIKNNEVLIYTVTWMNLIDIILAREARNKIEDLLFLLVIGFSRIKDLLYNVDIRIMFTFQGRVLAKRAQKSAFNVDGYVLYVYLIDG